jgi:nitronate monooxygenase
MGLLSVRVFGRLPKPSPQRLTRTRPSARPAIRPFGTKVLDALRGVPWPREYSYRFLKNKLTDEWSDREAEAFRAFGTLSAKYIQSRAQNDLDTLAVTCGEVVGLLKDRPTAESIVNSMAAQAADLLRSGGKLTFTSQL